MYGGGVKENELPDVEVKATGGSMLPAAAPDWRVCARELRQEEWEAHKECLETARYAMSRVRKGRKFTVADVARLLELASELGRRAAGMPTEHVEFSRYNDPGRLAEIDRQLDAVFGKVIEVPCEISNDKQQTPEKCQTGGSDQCGSNQ